MRLAFFIANFGSGKPVEIARAFQTYCQFKMFRPFIESFDNDKKIDMLSLKEEVQRRDPILILIDIGGTILYRTKSKLKKVPNF